MINWKPEGRKKRGHPRRTWKDGIYTAIGEREIGCIERWVREMGYIQRWVREKGYIQRWVRERLDV